jgi:oligopeptide/dipeptide ABC transporter ATP-binding protein
MTATGESTVPQAQGGPTLLRVEGLKKVFHGHSVLKRGPQGPPAVNDVSFAVARGETFGLVGESGCGKSTIARCIVRVTDATEGRITLDGIDVLSLRKKELHKLRRRMQLVFQDSSGTLNPRMTVRSLVEEPLIIHNIGTTEERRSQTDEILELVGISPLQSQRKPHALSGGQRQRLGLARALILEPDLVVLDEPVSAVDVSIQAQILNLLRELQSTLSLTYVFIVHDLTIAEYFCDNIAVLYLGQVMEIAPSELLFEQPLHPYTVGLLAAVPLPDPTLGRQRKRVLLRGEVEDAQHDRPTVGCPFKPRCPVGRERNICGEVNPSLQAKGIGHMVACHFPGEMEAERFTISKGPTAA